MFDTDCGSTAGLGSSLSSDSREEKSSSNSPGCIASPAADESTLKIDSRQSLATSRASGSAPGANSTASQAWFYCQENGWRGTQMRETQSRKAADERKMDGFKCIQPLYIYLLGKFPTPSFGI